VADDLVINDRVTIPAAELSWQASRASGPGGQHVNTTDSRIQLRWNVALSAALTEPQRTRLLANLAPRLTDDGEIILASDAHRSQRRNREEVARRLAQLVRAALVLPKPRKRTRPTAAARRKRLEDKKRRARIKRGRGRPDDTD
jgi:ribosome-associated protein